MTAAGTVFRERQVWMRPLDAILAVVWAPRCAACGDPLDAPTREVVCRNCWRRLPGLDAPVCDRCGVPLAGAGPLCGDCLRTGGPPTARRAAGVHAGPLRAIVHAFKYDGRRSLARPLARRMRDAAGDWLRRADVAVPVPLHALRRWRRGFNQAADLAAHLGVPVAHALRRRRHTGRQVELSRAARLNAFAGAFALAGGRGGRPAAAVRARSVVLVDDVITTGATVEACAAVLRNAGARDVRALSAALAVAVRSRPPSPPRRRPDPVPRRCAPSPAGRPDGDSSSEPA